MFGKLRARRAARLALAVQAKRNEIETYHTNTKPIIAHINKMVVTGAIDTIAAEKLFHSVYSTAPEFVFIAQ